MARNTGLDKVRDHIREFRAKRELIKELALDVKNDQPEVIGLMEQVDPGGKNGIVIDPNDSRGTAFIQQNNPTWYWDTEKVIAYLKANRVLWLNCSSRSFDPQKWEAEIANGNIPSKFAAKFKVVAEPPAPFIRFGKAKRESL